MNTELFVELVVPDTEALSTLTTAQDMGFTIQKIIRRTYYATDADEYLYDQLATNDLLVNVNKHRCFPLHKVPDDGLSYFTVLVKDSENTKLGDVLRSRFGVPAREVIQGTLWLLGFSSREDARVQGKQIAQKLLHNKHFQEVVYW